MRVACLNRAGAAIRMPAPTRTAWTDNLMASVRKAFDWSTVLITVCMLTAAVVVYLRDGQERFAAVFFNDLEIFLDILPKTFGIIPMGFKLLNGEVAEKQIT